MTFGQRLSLCRRAAGLTQGEVARQLMVTPQAVSKWETDGGAPDISLLLPLAALLGVTTDALLGADLQGTDIDAEMERLDHGESGSARERLEHCRALLRDHPHDASILARLPELTAEVIRAMGQGAGDRDALIADAEHLVATFRAHGGRPDLDARIHAGMARMYSAAGEYARAETEIDALSGARYTRARMHGMLSIAEGKNEAAVTDLRESITEALVWMTWDLGRLAGCYQRLGDREAMAEMYDTVYRLIVAMYGETPRPYPMEGFWQTALMRRAQEAAREGRSEEVYCLLDAYMESLRASLAAYEAGLADGVCAPDSAAALWLADDLKRFRRRRASGRNLCERAATWLSWHAFDGLREEARFRAYLSELATMQK